MRVLPSLSAMERLGGTSLSFSSLPRRGIDILRIAGGKIVEIWANFDMLGMLQQLGVVPAPGQTS